MRLEDIQADQVLRGVEPDRLVRVVHVKAQGSQAVFQDDPVMRRSDGSRRKLIVFTEHRDTLRHLEQRIAQLLGTPAAIVTIHGGVGRDARREAQERFRNDPQVLVLLATDAASEGVNLQVANLMINYDLPWNPNRLEQRFGRIHRIGQTEVCHLWNLVAEQTREGAVYHRLLEKQEAELVPALGEMMGAEGGSSPIAPVDLAQAAIGPGMAVFSRYRRVVHVSGAEVTVREALASINRVIDACFDAAEGELDADTRFCLGWFQEFGFKAGDFGRADVLARAKGTSVEGVVAAGVVEASGGKVRLLKVSEYPSDWAPESDERQPVWEWCHQLCRALDVSEATAGALLSRIQGTEPARRLAYRLYTLCERKGWATEARAYNNLIGSWHVIAEAAVKESEAGDKQGALGF